MVEKKNQNTNCYFCCYENIKEEGRIIDEGEVEIHKNEEKGKWFAFIPQDPEIFGHCIVTYEKTEKYPHIQNIGCNDFKEIDILKIDILKILNEGILTIVNRLKKIKNVEMVYFAMLGETFKTHMHYHLFPRYGFVNDTELNNWASEENHTRLSKGNIEWRKFFAKPTCGFKSLTGFQYLGEIERTYNEAEAILGKPSIELIQEMTEKINGKDES